MYIPRYQMHNVLNVYSKQLRQNKNSVSEKRRGGQAYTDRINISAEGKRKSIIEKISKDIADRISGYGSKNENEVDHGVLNQPQKGLGKRDEAPGERKNEFVFNVIDDNSHKSTNTFSIEDSDFLIKRLDAKKAVNFLFTQPDNPPPIPKDILLLKPPYRILF